MGDTRGFLADFPTWFGQHSSEGGWLACAVSAVTNRMCCCMEDPLGSTLMTVSPQTLEAHDISGHVTGIEDSEKVDMTLLRVQAGGKLEPANHFRFQLLSAVRADDAPGVLQHVADGADISLMGEALRLAAHRGSASVVRELVAVGLSVNEECPQTGFTPIQLATAGGHHLVCEVLLDALADVNKPIAGSTVLGLAHKSGHVEVEEVISQHIASLVENEQCENNDASQANRRAHVLPRVAPFLSEAVLQALPQKLKSGESGNATSTAAAVAAAAAAGVTITSSSGGKIAAPLALGGPVPMPTPAASGATASGQAGSMPSAGSGQAGAVAVDAPNSAATAPKIVPEGVAAEEPAPRTQTA